MATYKNTTRVTDGDIDAAIGSPTLTTGDVVKIIEGSDDYTAQMASLASADLAQVLIGGGYRGTIGGPGQSLEVDAATLRVATGGAFTYIKGKTGETITTAIIEPVGDSATVQLSAMTLTNLRQAKGRVTLADDAAVTSARIAGGDLTIRGAAAGAVTTLELQAGATARTERDIDTIDVGPGATLDVTDEAVTPTTMTIRAGGRVTYAGGAIGTTNLHPGSVLDLSGLTTDGIFAAATVNLLGPCRIIPPASASGLTGWRPSDANTLNDDYGLGDQVIG